MIHTLIAFIGGGACGMLVMAIFQAGKCDDDLHQLRERVQGPWHPVVIDGGQPKKPA